MKSTKKFLVATAVLMMLLLFIPVAEAQQVVWQFIEKGLSLKMSSPPQAYAGNNMTIKTQITAMEAIQNLTLQFQMIGPKGEGLATPWSYSDYIYNNESLTKQASRTTNKNVQIANDTSPGGVFFVATCTWKANIGGTWQNASKTAYFSIVYLRNKAYEDLQVENAKFKATHAYSNIDYDSARLLISIVAFAGTTTILFVRKRRLAIKEE